MTERESGRAGEGETGQAQRAGDRATEAGQPEARPEAVSPGDVAPSPTPPLAPSAVSAQALQWLDARESPPPPELRQRMAEALESAVSETVPGALAEGALSCLKAASEHPKERASALDLLAADALLTYALEAAAELGAETLKRMAESYGPDTLASLLPEEPEGER